MPRSVHPSHRSHLRATSTRLALATLALTLAGPALAQSRSSSAESERLYREELEACQRGTGGQDRAACLNEARSARMERRRGGLETPQSSLQSNALARCQVFQPGPDMEACRARVMGQGSVSGSIEGGGLLREYAITLPTEPASSGMGAGPQPATTAPSSAPPSTPSPMPASPDPQTQQQMQTPPPPTSSSPMGAPGSAPRNDTPMPPDHPPMDPRMQHPMNPAMHDPMRPPGSMPMQPQMQTPMQPDLRSPAEGPATGTPSTPGSGR